MPTSRPSTAPAAPVRVSGSDQSRSRALGGEGKGMRRRVVDRVAGWAGRACV